MHGLSKIYFKCDSYSWKSSEGHKNGLPGSQKWFFFTQIQLCSWVSTLASRAMCRKKRIMVGCHPVLYFTIQATKKYSTSRYVLINHQLILGTFLKCYIARVKMMRKDRLRRNICFPLCWSSPRSNYVPPVKTQHSSTNCCETFLCCWATNYSRPSKLLCNISLLLGN